MENDEKQKSHITLFSDGGADPNPGCGGFGVILKHKKHVKEGDVCRKCNTPVVRKENRKRKIKANQTNYFEYFMLCPSCNTIYMVEDARREVKRGTKTLFD